MKRRTSRSHFAATAATLTSLVLLGSACSDSIPTAADAEANLARGESTKTGAKTYAANLEMLNQSGVSGMAELRLDGNMLTVHIMARGLEPNMLHPQHIHGFMETKANAKCPTAEDRNEIPMSPMEAAHPDQLISLQEGADDYGPVQLSLTPFPTAPDGTINYTQTFTVDPKMIGPLQNRAIVLHGMTVPAQGGGTTYLATLPVACGQIRPANGAMMMN